MQCKKFMIVFTFVITFFYELVSRSALRKIDQTAPYITTQWIGENRIYTLRDSHLEVFPLFHMYDKKHVSENIFNL